jgi:hypothetical protein
MSCGQMAKGGATPQAMSDQGPRYDKKNRKKRTDYQVVGKSGIIRPDKSMKHKYL